MSITHKTIAKLAHVSVSTVSKALSESREASAETTELVKKIARENGYYESKKKRRVENEKTYSPNVAIICPELTSIYYSQSVEYLVNEIKKMGGNAPIYLTGFSTDELNRIVSSFAENPTIDGAISFHALKEDYSELNIPIVCVSSSLDQSKYDTIHLGLEKGLITAIKYLQDLGHSRIGFIGETNTSEKLIGFRNAMEELELPINPQDIIVLNKRFEEIGFGAVSKMLEMESRPTAVIGAYDEVAIGAIHALSQHNIKVPEEISVIGINDIPFSSYSGVPLTTISTLTRQACSMAVDLIKEKLFDGVSEVKTVECECNLIVRASTGTIFRKEEN